MTKGLHKTIVSLTVFAMTFMYLLVPAQAAMLYSASVTLSNPAASGSGTHAFSMKVKTPATIKGIKLQYLKAPSGSSQNPTSLSYAGAPANATSLTGLTGNWAVDKTTDAATDIYYLSKAAGDALIEDVTIAFSITGVGNPPISDGNTGCTTQTGDVNDTTGTCFIKISTWDTDTIATMQDETTNAANIKDSTTVSFVVTTLVTMTATVDSSMSFIVAGVAAGQAGANDAGLVTSTTDPSTYSTLPFGNLTVGTPQLMAHKLYVKTNAQNGYTVKLRSTTDDTGAAADANGILKGQYAGNNIDGFSSAFGAPGVWASPTNEEANVNSGFLGVNSNDTGTIFNGDAALKWAAMENDTWNTVMTKGGPDLGAEADAHIVSYAIEVNVYQPADTYTGTFQYQATPTY